MYLIHGHWASGFNESEQIFFHEGFSIITWTDVEKASLFQNPIGLSWCNQKLHWILLIVAEWDSLCFNNGECEQQCVPNDNGLCVFSLLLCLSFWCLYTSFIILQSPHWICPKFGTVFSAPFQARPYDLNCLFGSHVVPIAVNIPTNFS